jgi:cytochrome P450
MDGPSPAVARRPPTDPPPRDGDGATPAELGYDPWDPGFIADPYPALARLRDGAPVAYDERTDQWLVSRHADVNALLRDRRLGRSYLHVASHEAWGRTPPPADQAAFWDLLTVQMIDLEPPDHTRLRRLVTRAFTPRTVEALRPRIEDIVGIVIDHARGLGAFDLIADLLELVPVTVIAELLGIPEADRHLLRPWSADMTLMFELNPSPEMQRRATDASAAFSTYRRDLARSRRREPGEDLISELAAVVEAGGDRLTEDELIGTAVLLLNAGHEASVNGAANSWWALFRHPEALTRLRADPAIVPTAIEELLRFDTPAPMFERWVLEDIEVGGVRIPRGEELALQFASANRDPSAFDRPDEIILDRSPNPYLSFGAGIHYCLGAPLAKLEFDILFRRMLTDLSSMELVVEPRWKPRFILRGLDALPVRLR